MMAKLHEGAFNSTDWVYEIKWDGYRAVAEADGKDVRLYSRNGLSFEQKYPVVVEELQRLKLNAVLDGEIVVVNDKGRPDFQLLQHYEPGSSAEIIYYVFDCLYLEGNTLEDKTLLERKQLLKDLLPPGNAVIRYCEHVAEKGEEFFALVKKNGLEGMIAKKAPSRYREGNRSADWLKIKTVQTEEAIICGYTAPRGGRKHFGALVLGTYVKGKLTYIGHTGTGFNQHALKELHTLFKKYETTGSPFAEKIPVNAAVTWLRPELVCNLKFSEITREGIRRHPVFLGLRVDKETQEVTDKQNESAPVTENHQSTNMDNVRNVSGRKVTLTNLDKIFWPQEGYTKGDLVEYYDKAWKYMSRYLKGRPESLRRTPNGIKDEGFFHKDAGDNAPPFVETYEVYSESAGKDINYIVCNNKPTLLYMANLGCIEINPWNSTVETPDNPDYLVLDIDPSDKNTFEQVIETAQVIRAILERGGCKSYCKTSGATGLHVYVPLAAKYTYEQARDFAHMIAVLAQEELPGFTSLERSLKKRGSKNIYIDYLQNRPGQTLSSVYSARPKPGAPVSTPLDWKEVTPGLHPTDFHIKNILKRLEKKGDLFKPVLGRGIDMMKAIKKLGG
ncbi:MAG: DNA ligase D [Flavipsychrobacter sp.]|nr:DNA ligase D [Flavipsychrobacter sp.]